MRSVLCQSMATLADLVDAIGAGDAEALRFIRSAPELVQARIEQERFDETIGHQLYAGDSALHIAAAAVKPAIVQALLRAGADPDAVNRRGASALHYACDPRPASIWSRTAQREVIEHLVDAGSTIDRVEKAGSTPLRRAIRARSPEAVRCLLERGADANAPHGKQRTSPLELARHSTGASGTKGARAEQEQIIALLLANVTPNGE
ncbi:MAG: ankyrin repeat domain-containing protein [Kofleriaceae bacterium]